MRRSLSAGGTTIAQLRMADVSGMIFEKIMRAIAKEYDFPGYRPVVRSAVDLSEEQLASIAG